MYFMNDLNNMMSRPLNYISRAFKFKVLERMTNTYPGKPSFNMPSTTLIDKDFCNLVRLGNSDKPKMLVVAPYSGHHATLLRDTVTRLLDSYDVYVTDWLDAKNVPMSKGEFNMDTYIDYILDFIKYLGKDLHVLAVCQPSVPVLAATAILAQENSPFQPASLTLMGGPVDTRHNPTEVNRTSNIKWLDNLTTMSVPYYYAGAGRRVCPGFLLLQGFMNLNIESHLKALGNIENVEKHEAFYDEYRSVLDLPAEYFQDSVRLVFREHALPKGNMYWRGLRINTSCIKKTALLTIEGGRDDITGLGQTEAAHTICPNIPQDKRHHHVQENVGHYGVFSGSKWRNSIAPIVEHFTLTNS